MFCDTADLRSDEIFLRLDGPARRSRKRNGCRRIISISACPTNTASSKTCELAGGRYLETVDVPGDNEMYAEGKRQVMVCRFGL